MGKSSYLTERVRRFATGGILMGLCVFAASSGQAAEHRVWAGDFLRMGTGARALAMGNAYTAVGGDVYSTYYNPAGLALLEGRQFAVTHRYLSMDRHFTHAAFAKRIGPDADFGFSWIGAGTGGIEGRDLNGNRTGNIEDSRNSLGVTFSKMITPKVSAGVNAKISLWKLGGEDAKAVGFDAGVMYNPTETLGFAVVLRDINSRFTWNSDLWSDMLSGMDGESVEKEDELPLYWTTGIAWHPLGERLLVSFATESVEDNPMGYDLGAAWECNDVFTVRGGVSNWSPADGLDYGALGAGFGLRVTGSIILDYAYVTDMMEDDRTHVISLNLEYGE